MIDDIIKIEIVRDKLWYLTEEYNIVFIVLFKMLDLNLNLELIIYL